MARTQWRGCKQTARRRKARPRVRFAEDELARAIGNGARQCVILGAGLDTYAYRSPYPGSTLRIFEVDHPKTQAWKVKLLAEAGIPIPGLLIFAAVDFERNTLSEGLGQANFRRDVMTFFSWLGVTPYLTTEAMTETLALIASLPEGSGVVFDYALPRSSLSLVEQLAFDYLARRVAAAGEPFQLLFTPEEIAGRLRSLGFRSVEDLGAEEINSRYFKDRTDGLLVRGRLGRLISATI